jgi:hypothetical protein
VAGPDGRCLAVSEADTDRTAVKTYVPAYQKATWREHADELGMSQSEFVRTMVQAGRRGFDAPSLVHDSESTDSESDGADADAGSAGGSAGAAGFEARVIDALDAEEHLDWDALVAELSADLEERLETALESLQAENRVRYSGRHGGYTLVEP